MDLIFQVPVNRVSFGQVSYNLLKVARAQGHKVFLSPIGPLDLATVKPDPTFQEWLDAAIERGKTELDANTRAIKLWHLVTPDEHIKFRGQYERLGKDTTFISFFETDQPSKLELNVARQFDTIFTSRYTTDIFTNAGAPSRFVPLAFDKESFSVINKRYFPDDRIAFAMLGKFENRKHHQKILKAWTKRFGNNKKYYLQCAVYNPFFNPQMNANLVAGSMGGKHYWNVNPVSWIQTNVFYNDFLNSNHIVIGMSGGEGWGLPEFHTVGLGKHGVILNAHAYRDWANAENSVLVEPSSKIPALDGVFFKKDVPMNQGNIFAWEEDAFIAACETAIERYLTNPVNKAGLQLQETFTYEKTFNAILNR